MCIENTWINDYISNITSSKSHLARLSWTRCFSIRNQNWGIDGLRNWFHLQSFPLPMYWGNTSGEKSRPDSGCVTDNNSSGQCQRPRGEAEIAAPTTQHILPKEETTEPRWGRQTDSRAHTTQGTPCMWGRGACPVWPPYFPHLFRSRLLVVRHFPVDIFQNSLCYTPLAC